MGHPRVILERTGPGRPPGDFWHTFRRRAAQAPRRVLLPESTDPRVLSAASFLARNGLAKPVLVGEEGAARRAAQAEGLDLAGCSFDDLSTVERGAAAERLFEKRKAKGLTADQARALLDDPLYRAAEMLSAGRGDCFVGG